MKIDLVSGTARRSPISLRRLAKVYQVGSWAPEAPASIRVAKPYMKLVDSDDGTGSPVNRYGRLMASRWNSPPENAARPSMASGSSRRPTSGRSEVATIPAISTHSQQGEEARRMADVPAQLIRLCVGGEDPDDIIGALDQALKRV